MSDHYAIRRYHRQTAPVAGTNRKQYLRMVLILMLAAAAGVGYFVYSTGILADDNPRLQQDLLARINLERQANGLPVVQLNDAQTRAALATSRVAGVASLAPLPGTGSGGATNLIAIPKFSWATAGADARQQILDTVENQDTGYRASILTGKFRTVGIGISGDMYNYYVAITWA